MNVLLIGALGQLGTDIARVYEEVDDVNVWKADVDGGDVLVDITDRDSLRKVFNSTSPNLVINTAAFHNVPQCDEEPETAFAVNAIGVRDLGRICQERGCRLVHVSTDYVFGDGHSQPLPETECPAPLSAYGASKLSGEHLAAAECEDHLIVRSAALYGRAPCRAKGGQNFVGLMLRLGRDHGEVKVSGDEATSPTWTRSLARQIRLLAEKGGPGLYHACCGGGCTWHEFAQAIFELAGMDVRLEQVRQEDFPSPVQRPSYSVLDNQRLRSEGLDIMPPWREALASFLSEVEAG